MRRPVGWWLMLWCVACAGLCAAPALAQSDVRSDGHDGAPLTGRALILLEADDDVDEFVRVFVYEVVVGRLRDHGLIVERGDASALGSAQGTSAMRCLADRACTARLQRRQRATLVLAFHFAMAGGQIVITWRRSDAISRAPLRLRGDEGSVAASLARTLLRLDVGALPCVVTLSAEFPVALQIDGERASAPALVDPGAHTARAQASGREPWQGPLVCGGGRVLRVSVR
ncbi:MAG TPA: hypothetical protein ENK57_17175 [Polyangiaceae bacterium]|nr:hypothetical protein [Polyangiaceae bacterium]